MPFVVEDGSVVAGANSLVSDADWTAYFTYDPYGAACLALSSGAREKYMVTATRDLCAAVRWKGARTSQTQALDWPRYGITIDEGRVDTSACYGEPVRYVPDNTVPDAVKQAILKYCRFLKMKDRDAEADKPAVKRQKVDVIEREFFEAGSKPDQIPDAVIRLIREYIESGPSDSIGNIRLVRA